MQRSPCTESRHNPVTDRHDPDSSHSAAEPQARSQRVYRLSLLAALLIGVRLFLSEYFDVTLIQFALICAAALAACIPAVARSLARAMDRLRHPSRMRRLIIASAIWIAGSGYLAFTAHAQHRPLQPEVHDESSYLIQSHMLARGRLWLPQHPAAESFETFHVLVKPVYASMYFPGTALLYSPTAFFDLPIWVLPVCCSGLCLALLYLVTTAAIDGIAGLLAALLLTSVAEFRTVSVMFLSQIPTMLMGLCCLGSWMLWQKRRNAICAVLLGISLGWCAITRPVDAMAFAIPIGIAMLIQLRRHRISDAMRTIMLVAAGMAPFLSLQLLFDEGVTGHLLQTPYQFYIQRNHPGTEYGFRRFDPRARPRTKLPQKLVYYQALSHRYQLAQHQLNRLPAITADKLKWVCENSLPVSLLIVPLLAAPFALRNSRRWVVASVAPTFALLYAPNPGSAAHYTVPAASGVVFCICLGVEAVGLLARSTARRRAVEVFAILAVMGCAISSLPEVRGIRGGTGDAMFYPPHAMTAVIRDDLAALPHPSLVLFRYRTGDPVEEEPVYNSDVAWPDDARIVRAHELGTQEDRALIEYYANRRPQRDIYLYDVHAAPRLRKLGNTANPSVVLHELARLNGPSTQAMP